jgi:UDP-N-acetylmuramoyl-L-alanyl-D-glutamate--2,6-diaminopimelate ligase
MTDYSGMTVRELLSHLKTDRGAKFSTSEFGDCSSQQVTSLCFDSRKLERGCVFFAIKGAKSDGHSFLQAAVEAGAAALIVEESSHVPEKFEGAVVAVGSTRKTLNQLAAVFYGEPAKKLFCIGVTGTNGKTTTTYMTEAIFEHAGKHAGVIGTINHHYRSQIWPTEMTTPDPLAFQERLAQFVSLGATAVALEVSSHALRQMRVDEVPFDVAIFTNLTRDHLDYHRDMDDYFDAKHKLFRDLLSSSSKSHPTAILNDEDPYSSKIVTAPQVKRWTYGPGETATLRYTILDQGFDGTRFMLTTPFGAQDFQIQMVGLHMVANACGAIGAALAAGIDLKTCAEALKELRGVTGRLEAVPNSKGLHVFVDYAHTDDALATVLHYLNDIRRQSSTANRLITVFGCGGDRDRGKRPLMAKIAVKDSDFVVLTSDNPRTENPEQILDDAIAGVTHAKLGATLFREADRRKGIAKALELARPGDVVLIAGKGHEDYQILGTQKIHFSDFEVVQEILK